MWQRAMAKNTPAEKLFAMPRTLGLSLNVFDRVGKTPHPNASINMTNIKENLAQKTSSRAYKGINFWS